MQHEPAQHPAGHLHRLGLIEEHGIDDVRAALTNVVDERETEALVSTAHKS